MSNYSDSYFAQNPNTSWYKILNIIPEKSKVLDFGCSIGTLGEVIKNKKKCTVDGVEIDKSDAKIAATKLRRVYTNNIEVEGDNFLQDKYDVIYFVDVIEHLINPVEVLRKVKGHLTPDGFIAFSIPNMAHISVRIMLLGGKFEYGLTGLLDKTHLHFYDIDEVERLFNAAGYKIEKLDWVQKDVPQELLSKQLKTLGLKADKKFIKLTKSVKTSAYQFIGKAVPVPEPEKLKKRPRVSPPVNEFDNFVSELRKNYEAEIEALRKRVSDLEIIEKNLQRTHSSLSWKITKPLRVANRLRIERRNKR